MLTDDLWQIVASDGPTFLSMFWYAAVIEIPRFLIAGIYVGGREVTARRECVNLAFVGSARPTISILLPGHNESAGLERAIKGLHAQIQIPTQIVVIDDGSTDNMGEIGRSLKARGLIDVFISTGLRGGKAAALNLGLTHCTGDLVVTADVDTSFDREALLYCLEPFSDPYVGAVSGNLGVRNVNATIITRFQAIQYLNSISMGRRVNDMLFGLFIASGAFAVFRRDALNSVGGWTAGPGEDGDVSIRLRRAGWGVKFHADAWALTDVPMTISALLRQRARWTRSFVMLRFRKHAQVLNPFQSNFSILNAIGILDSMFFEVVRPMIFVSYLAWLFYQFGSFAWSILAVVALVYFVIYVCLFVMACAISGQHSLFRLLPYVPGAMLFNSFILRPAVVYASLTELFWRQGYRDTFLPNRVLGRIDRF